MINVGLAGIGFMGWIHYLAYQKVRGIRVSAICSRDKKKLSGDWRSIRGNFGPPGEQVDLSGIQAHREFGALLDDPDIDLIDLCLPPHLHYQACLDALRAGKHVFCEKPLAISVRQCRQLVQAAEKAERQLLVGHVLPFFAEYTAARRAITGGRYGKPIGGSFKRVISDPLWLNDFYDPERVGGPLIDLHVHDAHLICMLFGMPTKVYSQGRLRGQVVEYCCSQFQFEDPTLVVNSVGGVIHQQGRPFTHGFEIHLEKATIHFEFAAYSDTSECMPLKILTSKGKVVRPKLAGTDPLDAFVAEIKEVVSSLKAGKSSPILSGELARDAIALCHKQTESVVKQRLIKI